ncbi:MAG: ComEC/Rec2 family competence protein, partial [Bacteroidetes bacterium]|nr:ComEC/Rec2 family competence protein [Bacteroidota bacterium]
GKNTANPLFKSAWQLRDYFAHCYFNSGLNQENAGIIQALVLGNKTDVDAEILATFSQTGAMHLLAVSGLHVGIIYMVISTLIGFPRRYKKRKILAAIPVIAALWLYAMITGLSGSVMRASLMFTVMIIGQALNRKPPTYNTIAAAAFILLVADPMLLFDTGFQLSFAAVVGIVSIQPLFSELWQPAIKPMKWAYSLVSVSMAAQIATFPLGIFYFHQFPNYFLLTNLLVLPVATVLVYLVLLLPLTHGIEPFAGWISTTTDGIIQALRFMVDTTASLPFSSTGGIFISSLSVFLLYALIIGSFQFIISRKFRWIPFVLISVIVIAGKVKFQPNNQSPYQFVAYNARGKTIIELFDNQQSIVITDSDTSSLEYLSGTYHRMHRIHVSDIIHPDTIAKGLIETGNLKAYHGFLSFAGKRILMANRCNRYEIEHRVGSGECIDALVVTDNRMIPPDRLLEAVQAGFVLLSSTIQNPDLISEWQTSCELRKIPIWVCALNGAFCYRNTQ